MNIDIDRSTDELEARIAAAMHALAETHHPTAPGRMARPVRRASRVLSIAAVCLLVVGMGGLVVAIQGDGEPGPTGPAPTNESLAHSVTSPHTSEETSTSGPAGVARLPDGVVPILRHVPAGYPLDPALPAWDPASISWVTGVDDTRSFAVVDDEGLVAVVTATDESAPWALASSGLDPLDDLGVDAAVDADPVYEIVVRNGDLTRRFHDPTVDRSAIHEVAAAVRDQPLEAVEQTASVIPLPSQSTASTPISYGTQGQVQLTLLRYDEEAHRTTGRPSPSEHHTHARWTDRRGEAGLSVRPPHHHRPLRRRARSDQRRCRVRPASRQWGERAKGSDRHHRRSGRPEVGPLGAAHVVDRSVVLELHAAGLVSAARWTRRERPVRWPSHPTGVLLRDRSWHLCRCIPRFDVAAHCRETSGYTVETDQTGRDTSFIVTPAGDPTTPPRLASGNRALDCPTSD